MNHDSTAPARRSGSRRLRARPYLRDVKHLLSSPRRRVGKGGKHLAALVFRSVRVSLFDPPVADDDAVRMEQGQVNRNSSLDEEDEDSEVGFASNAYLGAIEDEAAAYYARAQQSGTTVIPLRVRPAFILFTVLDMILLAFLGFHPNAHRWTLVNDKLLHFICFFIATALFYGIFDVDDRARKSSWFWRDAPLYLTLVICFIVGSVGSEIIQSMLPYKTFQWGDVVANLLGSSLGMLASYRLEAYYRQQREISRLYRPVATSNFGGGGEGGGLFSDDDDDENEDETEEAMELHPPTRVMGLQDELDSPVAPSPLPVQTKPDKGKRRVRWGDVQRFDAPEPGTSHRVPPRGTTLFSLGTEDEEEEPAHGA